MGRLVNRLGWVVVIAMLVSAFWVFYFGIFGAPKPGEPEVTVSGEKITVDPKAQPPVTLAEGVTVGPAGLAIPVQGLKPANLVDTYTQARAGGARTHDAIDIMAAEGTPVISASDGTVEKLFSSREAAGSPSMSVHPTSGGSIIMPTSRAMHRVLRRASRSSAASCSAVSAHTGNANPAGPHLHFAINRMNPGEKWWQGTPINPYPLLAGKPVSR